MVRLHGVTEFKFPGENITEENRFFRFWPEHATTEILIGVLLMYILTILALIWPAQLGPQANPSVTPEHIKPEWYFYFNFRLLKLTSLNISVVLTLFIGLIALFWPFVESWLQKKFRLPDKASVIIGVVAFMGFLILTVWESFAN